MKHFGSRRNLIAITVMSLLLAMAIPATSFGKDRGRHGRGRNDGKKCGKFVNCHDARDGRVNGDIPRRARQHDRFHDRVEARHARFHERFGNANDRRHAEFHRQTRTRHARFHNRPIVRNWQR